MSTLETSLPHVTLAPGYAIPRVITGGWQLAGGHGPVDPVAAQDTLRAFIDAGLTAFDCADIYTGVETLIGDALAGLRRDRGAAAAQAVHVHTKYVPDRDAIARLTRADVRRGIERSLARLRVEALDLVQFHWWDFDVPGWIDTAQWLDDLRREGLIRHIGVTNTDTAHLTALLDAGVPVVSNQVQYSLLDERPAGPMAALCTARGVHLLAYGSLAGGYLTEAYDRVAEPDGPPPNRSLVKYRLIIDECGGWPGLQARLAALGECAARHDSTHATVASAWVLHQPTVAAVIVGARHPHHIAATRRIATLSLSSLDLATLAAALGDRQGPQGDVYALERVKGGRHAAIMRYNLNAQA